MICRVHKFIFNQKCGKLHLNLFGLIEVLIEFNLNQVGGQITPTIRSAWLKKILCYLTLHNTVNLRNLNFCANSARLLRKLDHVLLWILSNDTRLLQCSLCAEQRKFKWLAMFCIYTLHLAREAQAKIQNVDSYLQYCEVDSLKQS